MPPPPYRSPMGISPDNHQRETEIDYDKTKKKKVKDEIKRN